MSSYDSMIKAMRPIGVYSLDGGSYVESEIQSYAEELDALSGEIDEIIKESLVMTAEDDGLLFYEKLVGTIGGDQDLNARREMIVSLLRLNTNDNTHDGMIRFFKSLGMECSIVENPIAFDLYIKPLSGSYNASERRYIINRAKEFLPCHLTFTVDFRQSTWADYDAVGRTFNQIDNLNLTWEKFESEDF